MRSAWKRWNILGSLIFYPKYFSSKESNVQTFRWMKDTLRNCPTFCSGQWWVLRARESLKVKHQFLWETKSEKAERSTHSDSFLKNQASEHCWKVKSYAVSLSFGDTDKLPKSGMVPRPSHFLLLSVVVRPPLWWIRKCLWFFSLIYYLCSTQDERGEKALL